MPTYNAQKVALFQQIRSQLQQQGFTIEQEDAERPWGGFFVLAEAQAQAFADAYFDGLSVEGLRVVSQLSPKILVVAPLHRLSWQYHHRRAEIWQVVRGPVGVATSLTDKESETQKYPEGSRILLGQGERHRLVGLSNWGIVAEIWQHTVVDYPSDEHDIVRVQDDFGR